MEEQLHRHTAGTNVQEEDHEKKSMMKKVKEKVDKMKDTIKHGGHGSHDQHKDEAHTINNSAVVRSGLVQPTVMGTPVLAEDLYAQPAAMGTPVLAEDLYAPPHSDIVDPPMRSFSQWEEEERHGDPPPLSTGAYGTHPENLSQFGRHSYHPVDASRQQLDSSVEQRIGIDKEPYYPTGTAPITGYATHFKETGAVTDPYDLTADPTTGYATRFETPNPRPQLQSIDVYMTHPAGDHAYKQDVATEQSGTVMEEDPSGPNPTMRASPGNYQTKVTDPTNTGGKESTGITDVLHSFDKMKIFEEPRPKSTKADQGETEVFTGSHDQFSPELVKAHRPLDTIPSDPSNPNSSYTQKITSATSAIGQKAAAVKDSIISKFSSSDEDKADIANEPQKAKTKPSTATDYAHVVADTLSGTLGPVYEKVADAGTSVMSKIQGSGQDESLTSPSGTSKGATVKEYLVDAFKPGDDDKVLSEKITSVFNRGRMNAPQETTTTKTTTYVIKDEGERRLQDSGN
uniref:low-temperature-induced 65 kDa protein-like n=1 Tax=Erigeron canadensis TaxID=72917 RepID=UPI001CB9082B|nr:low-temperature-induced 65 kDa protein-like [Erigeron canadensis]